MADEPTIFPTRRPICSCHYPSTVKLDPTTRAGASCARCGYPPEVGIRDEVCIIDVVPFSLPE